MNETSEEHNRSETEPIFKKIKEIDIKGKINLSNTETQHKLGELSLERNHNSYNKFLFHSLLSALHVSNESSRSSLGARHNVPNCVIRYIMPCC